MDGHGIVFPIAEAHANDLCRQASWESAFPFAKLWSDAVLFGLPAETVMFLRRVHCKQKRCIRRIHGYEQLSSYVAFEWRLVRFYWGLVCRKQTVVLPLHLWAWHPILIKAWIAGCPFVFFFPIKFFSKFWVVSSHEHLLNFRTFAPQISWGQECIGLGISIEKVKSICMSWHIWLICTNIYDAFASCLLFATWQCCSSQIWHINSLSWPHVPNFFQILARSLFWKKIWAGKQRKKEDCMAI